MLAQLGGHQSTAGFCHPSVDHCGGEREHHSCGHHQDPKALRRRQAGQAGEEQPIPDQQEHRSPHATLGAHLGFWSGHSDPGEQCCVPHHIYSPQCLPGALHFALWLPLGSEGAGSFAA